LLQAYPETLRNWDSQGSFWHLEIWLRDNGRCAYCERDLLSDRDLTYFFYCYDHILPVSRFPLLKDAAWNKVLACRACNSWKGTFDSTRGEMPATEEYRDELIERAKQHVFTQRRAAEELLVKEVSLIRAALVEYPNSRAAISST